MIITAPGVALLRARTTAALAGRLPGHARRLSWDCGQLAAFQRRRLRELLARAIRGSPFHAGRLAGIDPGRFELPDLPQLPVMTKKQMMANFERVVTNRRLTRDLVNRHLAGSGTDPALLLGDFVCLVSGGSSGLRGVFVQTLDEYSEFGATVTRRPFARLVALGEPPPGGVTVGMVGAASPVHSSGFGSVTITGPPLGFVSIPATLPTAELVERLNAVQPAAHPVRAHRPVLPGRGRLGRLAAGRGRGPRGRHLPLRRRRGAPARRHQRPGQGRRGDRVPGPPDRPRRRDHGRRRRDFDRAAVIAAVGASLRRAGVREPLVTLGVGSSIARDPRTGKIRRFIPLGAG